MKKVIQTGMEGVEPCLCVFYNYSLFYFMCNRGKHIIKTSTHQCAWIKSASFGLAALMVSNSVVFFSLKTRHFQNLKSGRRTAVFSWRLLCIKLYQSWGGCVLLCNLKHCGFNIFANILNVQVLKSVINYYVHVWRFSVGATFVFEHLYERSHLLL